MIGILLVDKPRGITSHDAVNRVRRALGTRRVGHAGTLDPLATGLLVVAVGPATRFLQYLPLEPKEYLAEYTFGLETTSYDSEGEDVRRLPLPDDLEARAAIAVAALTGTLSQLPPMHSAVKMGGKPLYEYARKGQEIERQPRSVMVDIHALVGPVEEGRASVRIVCSGGTYVRTLAHDAGQLAGCGAHVSALRRTRIGRFAVEDAVLLDQVDSSRLIPLSHALVPMPMLSLDADHAARVRDGMKAPAPGMADGIAALLDPEGRVIGAARCQGGWAQPECVIPAEAMNGLD